MNLLVLTLAVPLVTAVTGAVVASRRVNEAVMSGGLLLTFVLCLAILAAVLMSLVDTRSLAGLGFWSVIFSAAAAAAWQVGPVPIIATFVVRN